VRSDYPHIQKSLDTITPISADSAHPIGVLVIRSELLFCVGLFGSRRQHGPPVP
jgi:hypothetical protein